MNLTSAVELRDSEGRPRSAQRPPEHVSLSLLGDCMEAITAAMLERGESIRKTCRRAVLDPKTFAAWRSLGREPSVAKFSKLAWAAGYDLVMIGSGIEIDAADQAAVISALDVERKRRGLTILDIDSEIGIPGRTWSYWRAGNRPASLRPLVMLAESFGFAMIMRRVKKPPKARAG